MENERTSDDDSRSVESTNFDGNLVDDSSQPSSTYSSWDDFSLPHAVNNRDLSFLDQNTLTTSLQTGDIVDGYSLMEVIGLGGMGEVFKARDPDGNIVAIKSLKPELVRRKNIDTRIEKEIRSLSLVKHPNVLSLISVLQSKGRPVIVTEYVDGMDLFRFVQTFGKLSLSQAIRVFLPLLDGLANIHQHGLIHRDIKPSNILLRLHRPDKDQDASENATPEIASGLIGDFGLARSLEQSPSMQITLDGAIVGTPAFMAPEQFDQNFPLDTRSDLFSLGATLLFAITGNPPAENIAAKFSTKNWLFDLLPDVTPDELPVLGNLQLFLENAIAEKPVHRFQSADWMWQELTRVIEKKPTRLVRLGHAPVDANTGTEEVIFEWDLPCRLSELWQFVADTNQINQLLGFPSPKFTNLQTRSDRFAEESSDANSQRNSNTPISKDNFRTKLPGLQTAVVSTGLGKLRWLEFPFQWIVGKHHLILREFENGPFCWLESKVEIAPIESGCKLIHRFRFQGRGRYGATLGRTQLKWLIYPKLNRIYRAIGNVIAQNDRSQTVAVSLQLNPHLSEKQIVKSESRIFKYREKILEHRVSAGVVEPILQSLARLTAIERSQILPIELAERLSLPLSSVVDCLLAGTDSGLLKLKWLVICPVCRVSAAETNDLSEVQVHQDCSFCQKRFRTSFTESVGLSFELSNAIAAVERQRFCVGGPFHLPHVLVQRVVPGNSVLQLDLEFEEGRYEISGPQLANSFSFEVSRDGRGKLSVSFHLDGSVENHSKSIAELSKASQVLLLHNDSDQELLVRIQRAENAQRHLSVARVLSLPSFARLFPGQISSIRDLRMTRTLSVVAIRLQVETLDFSDQLGLCRRICEFATKHGAELIRRETVGTLVFAFENLKNACDCLVSLLPTVNQEVACCLGNGPISSGILTDDLVHSGKVIDDATSLLLTTNFGEIPILDDSTILVEELIGNRLPKYNVQAVSRTTKENA